MQYERVCYKKGSGGDHLNDKDDNLGESDEDLGYEEDKIEQFQNDKKKVKNSKKIAAKNYPSTTPSIENQ